MRKFIHISILFILGLGSLNAQVEPNEDPNAVEIPSDSTAVPTKRGALETLKVIFEGKPGKAATYGLLIPGGGQIYNKKYWKAPIVWAADGAAIYWYIYNRELYILFREGLKLKLQGSLESVKGISDINSMRSFRDEFRLQSERAGIIILALHLVSVIEAFTDQHLMDFDIDENLSSQFKFEQFPVFGEVTTFGISYNF